MLREIFIIRKIIDLGRIELEHDLVRYLLRRLRIRNNYQQKYYELKEEKYRRE